MRSAATRWGNCQTCILRVHGIHMAEPLPKNKSHMLYITQDLHMPKLEQRIVNVIGLADAPLGGPRPGCSGLLQLIRYLQCEEDGLCFMFVFGMQKSVQT